MPASPDAIPAAGGPHVLRTLSHEIAEVCTGIDHEISDGGLDTAQGDRELGR